MSELHAFEIVSVVKLIHRHLIPTTQFNADACTVDVDGNLAVDHAKDSSVTALLAGYMDHYGIHAHSLFHATCTITLFIFAGMHDPELQAARAHQAKTVMGHVLNAISRRRNLNELNENGVTLVSVFSIHRGLRVHTLPLS